MKKLLILKQKGTTLCLNVTEKSDIVKNPVPILWFNEGLYGWISVCAVINEIQRFLDNEKVCPGLAPAQLEFTWNQILPILSNMGEILMSFAEKQD